METPYQSPLGKLSAQIAFASFALGTLLLVVGIILEDSDKIIDIGLVYMSLTAVFSALLAFVLVIGGILSGQYRYYGGKILVVLANYPISIVYAYLFAYFHRLFHQS